MVNMSNGNTSLKLIFQQNEKICVILVTMIFFFCASYVAIFHHPYFAEDDGMFYLRVGEEILKGNYQNIKIPDAPPGGPIFYAFIDQFVNDGFLTLKSISVVGSTCIIFVSYFIIRNIFGFKIAIIGQLLIATNTRLFYLSYAALNEIIPLLLIFTSLYFITRQKFSLQNIIISAVVLGIATSFRYQALIVFIAIIIYLIIRNRKIRNNLKQVIIFSLFFILALSPMLILNFTTHGTLIDSTTNQHIRWHWEFQTPEWRQNVESFIVSGNDQSALFIDPHLFLKNYLYNFFYNNPDKIFNFNTFNTISIFPMIPVLGLIIFAIGYIHVFNFKLSKERIIFIGIGVGITLFTIYQIGDTDEIFFALIFVPLLIMGIMNFKKINENLLLMMILSLVFLAIFAISNISRAYQFYPMWLIIPALSAVFFVEILPKILSKLKIHRNQTKLVLVIITIVIILNVGAAGAFSYIVTYPHEFNGIMNEVQVILSKEPINPQGYERKIVGDMLSHEKNIETSYIMATAGGYSYHAGSKWIMANFWEGKYGDSIQSYINRENWSDYDLLLSNIGSFPPDSNNIINPTPDYIIYEKINEEDIEAHIINSGQYKDLMILLDPNNPKIPSNFELLWSSDMNDIVVYRINK